MATRAMLVAVALAAAGCGGGAAAAPGPIEQTAPEQLVAGIELLDQGAEPRHHLRYRIEPGARGRMEMTFATTTEVGGEVAPGMPPFTITLDVAALSADRMEVRVADIAVDGGDPTITEAVRGQMLGTVVTMSFDPFGATGDFEASGSPAAETIEVQLRESAALLTRLPGVRVGAGARWRETRTGPLGNIQGASITTTYEVVAVSPTTATIVTSVTASAASQEMAMGGQTATVEGFAGSGTGTAQLDLTRIGGDGEATFEASMTLSVAGQSVLVSSRSDITVDTN